mmetsp:Transcript_14291/g.31009  ORF Transcript_14291/g.31009 Transcript_14291/m.31009 type:complete len:873 (+) Transcript_14291:64-2682(+)|eukprot:CAMPEP_0172321094 /NCGR_PEP_ID=MMETSP1058-20130122/42292_1 /TAXON_ID=83371 /ORGANISM="Detonula confervacea, Strain CCMP 353" /LENGTH=872 /DNA_ID=CAMNT_0013036501 /DNA_START=24 /DNA_END=2642 /DNA_ORIENTATION=+
MAPSSSSSSSSSEDDIPTTASLGSKKGELVTTNSKPKKNLDAIANDNASDDDDEDGGLKINTQFARQYEVRKRREELTKHRTDRRANDGSDDDESSSESEDEEGDLLTPHLDVQILKTLQALKSGDERVYDKNVDFYDKSKKLGGDDASDDDGEGKQHKPKRYKDVMREQILETMKEDEAGGKKGGKTSTEGDANGHNFAYDEEQRDIRRAFLESTEDGDDDNDGENKKSSTNESDDSDEDEDWIKPKHKKNALLDDDDEEAKKLWQEELQNNNTKKTRQQKGEQKETKLADPKGEVKDGDQFLMEFMTHRKWMENSNNPLGSARAYDNSDAEDDGSLADLERMDEFESKYNFRFEEANDKNTDASGAAHSIVHYARSTSTAAGATNDTLRRPDESRKIKRQARKERKAAERRAKEEKLKRLKNAKREELEGRMEQVRSVLGYNNTTSGNHDDAEEEDMDLEKPDVGAGLGEAEEQMILKLMEGEYDADKFEKVMQSAYGEEYYSKEDEVWKSDGDVKRDLKGDGDAVDGEDDVEGDEDEGEDEGDGNEDDNDAEGEEYYEDEQQEWNDEEQQGEANDPTSQLDKKLKSKLQSELYKLDYEDIIGDLPTRFKYRTVQKNSYGLSNEEILFADDATLKQFVSLKKMVPYIGEDEEYMPGTKKRKKFRQMLKAEKKERMTEEEIERESKKKEMEAEADGGGDGKKKRRRQKKKSDTLEEAAVAGADADKNDSIDNNDANKEDATEETTADTGGGEEPPEPEKKRRRRKKKQGKHSSSEDAAKETATAAVDNTATDNKKPSEEAAFTTSNEGGTTKPVTVNKESSVEQKKDKKKKDKKKKDKKNHDDKQDGKKKRKRHLPKVEGVSGARLAAYGI